MTEMEICGKVTYLNNKNNKMFTIHDENSNKKFRCISNIDFFPIKEGDAIYGVCEYVNDKRYGHTLIFNETPFVMLGEDENTILRNMLQALRGTRFGNMKAHSLMEVLIKKYKNLTNAILNLDNLSCQYYWNNEKDPKSLVAINYVITESQILKLFKWWYKNRVLRKLYLLGINNKEIYNANMSPIKMYKLCLENPYLIFSLSIEKCDEILLKTGGNYNEEMRYCGILSRKVYSDMNKNGWIGTPSQIILNSFPNIENYIEPLKNVFGMRSDMNTVYLPYPYSVENGIAELVKDLLDKPPIGYNMHSDEIIYTRNDLSQEQKDAVHGVFKHNISIITGIPGSGKSTAIKEIAHNMEHKGIKHKIASFTGKAVVRIREILDKTHPMTMNMMIALGEKQSFDHLIIDEASMVTSSLLWKFIKKFKHNYRITFIGDCNQLTPIGWGTLFEQLIKSGKVPIYKLNYSYRSTTNNTDKNGILINASRIVEYKNKPNAVFNFEQTNNFNIVEGDIQTIKTLLMALQDNGIQSDKIITMCPFNRYLKDINSICQEIYNGVNRHCVDKRGITWRINDRVMMTENDYRNGIMNGDEGIVSDISSKEIMVKFNHDELSFKMEETEEEGELSISQLTLSFAVSIHRYQGSEKDYVILYVPYSNSSSFLNRNLVYTAITRAKKCIWLIGDPDTINRAAVMDPPYRCDNLSLRIKKICENND